MMSLYALNVPDTLSSIIPEYVCRSTPGLSCSLAVFTASPAMDVEIDHRPSWMGGDADLVTELEAPAMSVGWSSG